jgi:hypothetical protein
MSGPTGLGVLLLTFSVGADPVVVPPPAPPPYALAGPGVALPPGIGFYRPNPYDHWQAYSPDRYGRWRPRVLIVPGDGAFRAVDGRPYPYPYVHPSWFMPYASD